MVLNRKSAQRLSVKRDSDKREIIETLQEIDVYEHYYEVLFFAAAVGYKEQKKSKIKKPMGDPIPFETFKNITNFPGLYYLIGLSEFGSEEALKKENEREVVEIFQEYANGGLEVLSEYFETQKPIRSTLLNFINDSTDALESRSQKKI